MSGNLLAYCLIKSVNLTTLDEQLVKATINKLSCNIVKSKLTKIFLEHNKIPTADFKELHIKQEPMYHAQNYLYNEAVGPNQEKIFVEEDETTQEETYQTLYTRKETCTIVTEA